MWKNRILCLICVCVCVFKLLKLLLFQKRIVLLSFFIFLMRAQGPPIPTATHICSSSSSFYLLLPLFPHLLPISLFASKPYFAKVIKLHPNHSTNNPRYQWHHIWTFDLNLWEREAWKREDISNFFWAESNAGQDFFFFFLRR